MTSPSTLVRCAACGALNRIPVDKLQQGPKCGKCHAPLTIGDRPVETGSSTFAQEVLQWPGAVLVEFWSPYCGHCRMLAPVLERIAHEKAGVLKIATVDITKQQLLAQQFGVNAVPKLILYRNGTKVDELNGALPEPQLKVWLNARLGI